MTADNRPHVRVEPSMRFGWPHIDGIGTEAIAGQVMAGEDPNAVADDYNLTRAQVLIACWHEARYGTRSYRRRWKTWLAEVEPVLWNVTTVDYTQVTDPYVGGAP